MYKLLRISQLSIENIRTAYRNNPRLAQKTYCEQMKILDDNFVLWPGNYCYHLNKLGYKATNIISNANSLQEKWKEEQKSNTPTGIELLVEQIKYYNPDILFLQHTAPFESSPNTLQELKIVVKNLKKIVIFRNIHLTPEVEHVFSQADLILTGSELTLNSYREKGFKTDFFRHSFDERLLDKISIPEKKTNKVVFAGGVYPGKNYHNIRKDYLDYLLEKSLPIDIFSSNPDQVFQRHCKTPVYNIDYFNNLSQYTVNFNNHIDSSGDCANNMRLFEATGLGSCLLTDMKQNLSSLFNIGGEVETFSGKEEALEKGLWLLNNPKKAKEIALAGQKRTLKEHTLEIRTKELDYILRKNM